MPHSPQDLYNKILGRAGEKKAENYLKEQGYKLLKRNYHTPFGEADLVMQDKEDTVFIEVKTRASHSFSTPKEAVTGKKQRRYTEIARFYQTTVEEELFIRFDVIEIEKDEINHIKNAFLG